MKPQRDQKGIAAAVLCVLCALCGSSVLRAEDQLLGAVVRSDQWVVRRKIGQEEFTGNVSVEQPGRTFKSDWALWDKINQLFFTKGRSYASKKELSGEILEAWSDEGRYNLADHTGKAWSEAGKDVLFKRTTADGQVLEGRGVRANWTGDDKQLHLEQSVRLVGSSETARSESADYFEDARTLELAGGPPVVEYAGVGEVGAMQAIHVTMYPDDGKLHALGKVHGWVHWTSKEKKEPAP
jgi:hypothetical protein